MPQLTVETLPQQLILRTSEVVVTFNSTFIVVNVLGYSDISWGINLVSL